MAHAQSNSKSNKATAKNATDDSDVKSTTFHDFLGNKGQESAPAAVGDGRPPSEGSPSSTSDLASERHVGNHLEGIPFYGSRGDISGPESRNRFTGYKRSNSDSFMMSRDKFPQGLADSQDNPLLAKLLRYSGGERPRRPHDEEASFGMHQMRPISAFFISQSSASGRTDNNPSKWDRATSLNPGPTLQYPPRSGQTAADEGSRTEIKGSGVLSSINAAGAMPGRQPAGVLIRSGKQKSGVGISEPESSTAPGCNSEHSMEQNLLVVK
ncbi:hypothetical protein ACS0TY_035631 [Phlomoides rotata]